MAKPARKANANKDGRAKPRARTCWRPGQSGNPKGRPPSSEALAAVVRREVSPQAIIERMQHLADHAVSEMVRFHALAWLAERGWGKAPQEVKVMQRNPYAGRMKNLTIEQLEALAALAMDDDESDESDHDKSDKVPPN